jgi:hypothetical protein
LLVFFASFAPLAQRAVKYLPPDAKQSTDVLTEQWQRFRLKLPSQLTHETDIRAVFLVAARYHFWHEAPRSMAIQHAGGDFAVDFPGNIGSVDSELPPRNLASAV